MNMVPMWFWFVVAVESGILTIATVWLMGDVAKYIRAKKRKEVYGK